MAAAWHYDHVSEYLAFVRRAFAVTTQGGTVRTSWCGGELDAAAWRRSFRDALERRITLKGGAPPAWRRLDDQHQTDLQRDARDLERLLRHRIRPAWRRWRTREVQARFGHLLEEW
jgi:hypothetical protein